MAISSVNQLVANIRSQLAANAANATANTATNRKTGSKQASLANQASLYDSQNLENLIGQRIKQIERDAPNRGKKAFRVFLEAVLLSQLGEHLINDPKFYQLLDDVQGAIENNPATREMAEEASAQLLREN